MSTIINPFDLSQVRIEDLLKTKQILPAAGQKVWRASLFPKSTDVSFLSFDKDHTVTLVDDELFSDFNIIRKVNQNVYVNRGTGRRFIKSIEIGDYNDSVKRKTQLDKPVDYNKDNDAHAFLNLPKVNFAPVDVILDNPVFVPPTDITAREQKKPSFDIEIAHPHITPLPIVGSFKHNNKATIVEVLKWAKDKGVKYIYCINERRCNIISNEYVTPVVYYTVRGSL